MLDCSIFPAPYCDTYFNLSLSNPKNKIAVCRLIDDINNKINCTPETLICNSAKQILKTIDSPYKNFTFKCQKK